GRAARHGGRARDVRRRGALRAAAESAGGHPRARDGALRPARAPPPAPPRGARAGAPRPGARGAPGEPRAGIVRIDLTIVIVSYNARADLERCLASLAAAPPRASHEIVVVDNASSDGSADAARAAGVTVIDAGGNLGFSRANNLGIRATRG